MGIPVSEGAVKTSGVVFVSCLIIWPVRATPAFFDVVPLSQHLGSRESGTTVERLRAR